MSAATYDKLTSERTPARHPVRAAGLGASIADLLGRWHMRIQDRRALAIIEPRDLRDLHLSRWEIEQELAKPFWRD